MHMGDFDDVAYDDDDVVLDKDDIPVEFGGTGKNLKISRQQLRNMVDDEDVIDYFLE